MADNTVTVTVNGQKLTGFEQLSLTRGIENVPSSFTVGCTEKYPNKPDVQIKPGYACTVSFGSDVVLTGYIDTYSPNLSASDHSVTITGVSTFSNLTRNSAVLGMPKFDGDTSIFVGAIISGSVNDIATELCTPQGVQVTGVKSNMKVPDLQFSLGQTPYEIIEQVSRYASLLVYDNPQGNLVFANVSTGAMASGFREGFGVEVSAATFDISQRYSDYYAVMNAVDTIKADGVPATSNLVGYAKDEGVKSLGLFRPYIFVSEQSATNPMLAQQRANWEANRRFGRGQVIKLVVSGPNAWRDSSGSLWAPNYSVPVDLPTIKVKNDGTINWIIAQVDYSFSLESGTTAQITLMPDKAFFVEPVSLDQEAWDLVSSLPK